MFTLKKSTAISAPSLALVLGSPSVLMAQAGPECAIVHVNIDRPWIGHDPTEDGESWSTAFRFLQDGIAGAEVLLDDPIDPPPCVEIWVAAGIYRPGMSRLNLVPPLCGAHMLCDRNATFNLLNNVELYGGFVATETVREQRDWVANRTILSGDVLGDDPPLDDPWDVDLGCEDDPDCVYRDNIYLIVNAEDVNDTAILDGFTVTGGAKVCYCSNSICSQLEPVGEFVNCTNLPVNQFEGAGVRIVSGSPIIRNCTITRNRVSWEGPLHIQYDGGGAGIAIGGNSMPRIENCIISENFARDGGVSGGGVGLYQPGATASERSESAVRARGERSRIGV